MGMTMMLMVFAAAFSAAVGAIVGDAKGSGVGLGVLLGLVGGPVGWVVVAILPRSPEEQARYDLQVREHRRRLDLLRLDDTDHGAPRHPVR